MKPIILDLGALLAAALPPPPLLIPTKIIFDNANWIVTSSELDINVTFEVVRKREDKDGKPTLAFLHGASAEWLLSCIRGWQAKQPMEEQVEATLAQLEWINATPLEIH